MGRPGFRVAAVADNGRMAYPPYAPYPPVPPRPPRRTRGATITLVIGIVLVVVSGLIGAAGFWLFGDAVTSAVRTGEEVREGLDAELDVPGEVEVELDEGLHTVYVIGEAPGPGGSTTTTSTTTTDPTASTTGPRSEEVVVTVTAEDGRELPVTPVRIGRDWYDAAAGVGIDESLEVRIPERGTYTVTVEQAELSAPVERVGIGPEVTYGDAVGRGLGSVALISAAFLVAGLGGVLALVGFIWLMVAVTSR